MSSGLILNHMSASGNHTVKIKSVPGEVAKDHGALFITGAAMFATPRTPAGELFYTGSTTSLINKIGWPGTDVNFFVSGSTNSTHPTNAVFGGNVFVSGALSAGSITGGLSAAGTPAAKQVAIWTGASTLKGDSNLTWDDSNLYVNGNLQVQGTTTAISSSNFTIKDSIIGIGFSGSDTYDNKGDRGLIFGRGTTGARLPAILLADPSAPHIMFAKTPTSPASGSFNRTLGDAATSHIRVPHTASTTNDLLEVHMGKFVSPVASYGSVVYPGISGSICDVGGGTYSPVLQTTRLKVGKNLFLNYGVNEAVRIDNQKKITFGASTTFIHSPASGKMSISSNGTGAALQLSASSGYVGINAQSFRPHADNVSSLGVANLAWSDLFLGDGGVINFNNGNATLTQATNQIAVKGHWVPDADSTYTLGSSAVAWDTLFADTIDLNGQSSGGIILDTDGDTKISAESDDVIVFNIGGNNEFEMDTSAFYPSVDNQNDLGSIALRFRNIYTGDLNLQNDRGDWTLIEEQDFISFRNNKTGRRFRMIMEDITGMGNYGPGNDGEM